MVAKQKICTKCQHDFIVDFDEYSALGVYNCPSCGWVNYVSDYERMDIGLSELCNLKCNMCRRPQEKAIIEPREAKLVLEEAKLIGVSSISFSGGEPFIHPHFREILSKALDLGFHVELVTNGTLVKEKDIPILEKLKCVTISIDGPEYIHDKIRGVKGSWQRSIRTIKLLSNSSSKWGTNTVIQKDNSECLEETWRVIRDSGRPSYASFCHVEIIPETKHLLPNERQFKQINKAIRKIKQSCEMNFIHFNDPEYHGDNANVFSDKNKRYRPVGGCMIPKKFLGFSQYGFFPCWHQGRYLSSDSLISALQTDLCKEIIAEGINRKCIGCNAANYSWDKDWVNGIIESHDRGECLLGEVYLSEYERAKGELNVGNNSIPIIQRVRKED